MKIWTLIWREIRLFIPKSVIVFTILFAVGAVKVVYNYGVFRSGEVPTHNLWTGRNLLENYRGLLQLVCIGLGISAAWVQFGRPGWRREWSFWLHRPIPRWKITLSKLVGATVPLLLVPMTACYIVWHNVVTQIPLWAFGAQQLLSGWLLAFWGYAFYLATALVLMENRAWLFRRALPLLLVVAIWFMLYTRDLWSLTAGYTLCGGVLVLFSAQLFGCMQRRAF